MLRTFDKLSYMNRNFNGSSTKKSSTPSGLLPPSTSQKREVYFGQPGNSYESVTVGVPSIVIFSSVITRGCRILSCSSIVLRIICPHNFLCRTFERRNKTMAASTKVVECRVEQLASTFKHIFLFIILVLLYKF